MRDSSPKPLLPPVTTIVFPSKEGISLSGLNENDEKGNMIAAAELIMGGVRCFLFWLLKKIE